MLTWPVPLLLTVGLAANLVAIWYLDRSGGMTWPVQTLIVVVTILFAQKCFAVIIHQDRLRREALPAAEAASATAVAGGWSLGPTIGVVLVALVIGSAVMGYVFGDDPAPTLKQLVGYALAIAGIALVKFG